MAAQGNNIMKKVVEYLKNAKCSFTQAPDKITEIAPYGAISNESQRFLKHVKIKQDLTALLKGTNLQLNVVGYSNKISYCYWLEVK